MHKQLAPQTSNVSRYDFRRLSPAEFTQLRKAAGLSVRDFMFLTGRHSHLVAQYHGETAKNDQRPSMGDVMIMELLVRDPDLAPLMFDIANSYSAGPRLRPTERK